MVLTWTAAASIPTCPMIRRCFRLRSNRLDAVTCPHLEDAIEAHRVSANLLLMPMAQSEIEVSPTYGDQKGFQVA
jgi:hypothetical protein